MSLRTCPKCGSLGRTIDSRQKDDHVTRRYACVNGHRYSTIELVMEVQRGVNTLNRLKQGIAAGEQSADVASALRTVADMLAPPPRQKVLP